MERMGVEKAGREMPREWNEKEAMKTEPAMEGLREETWKEWEER